MTNKQNVDRNEVNSEELKTVAKHLILTNQALQKEGKRPIAFSIEGSAGLGKSSVPAQVCKELGIKNFHVINLAQLEELGDLIGIPVKEYQMTRLEDSNRGVWVDERLIEEYQSNGYKLTKTTRMNYSKPGWLVGKGEGGVLVLDDYTRAQPRFLQAAMEIILHQKYVSWELPKNWTIILTENPASEYDVQEVDAANKSRYLKFTMCYDAETWAVWAEKEKIDGRAINFMLMNPEVITNTDHEVNPRAFENFFNSIKYITDFSANIPLITQLGEAAVGSEAAQFFVMFIENKLDKLITPQQMLDPKRTHKEVLDQIGELLEDRSSQRTDISYTLVHRLVNYILETDKLDITPVMVERVTKMLESKVFGADLNFVIAKKVTRKTEFFSLLSNTEIANEILS